MSEKENGTVETPKTTIPGVGTLQHQEEDGKLKKIGKVILKGVAFVLTGIAGFALGRAASHGGDDTEAGTDDASDDNEDPVESSDDAE